MESFRKGDYQFSRGFSYPELFCFSWQGIFVNLDAKVKFCLMCII